METFPTNLTEGGAGQPPPSPHTHTLHSPQLQSAGGPKLKIIPLPGLPSRGSLCSTERRAGGFVPGLRPSAGPERPRAGGNGAAGRGMGQGEAPQNHLTPLNRGPVPRAEVPIYLWPVLPRGVPPQPPIPPELTRDQGFKMSTRTKPTQNKLPLLSSSSKKATARKVGDTGLGSCSEQERLAEEKAGRAVPSHAKWWPSWGMQKCHLWTPHTADSL
jgi:hypothetical protein